MLSQIGHSSDPSSSKNHFFFSKTSGLERVTMQTKDPKNNDLQVTEYQLSGKGVKRVVQESVKTKTNVAFVYDKSVDGRLIRVGYCFTSRDTGEQVSPINWFNKNEIGVSSKKVKGKKPGTGRLDVKFRHPKKNEKHFNITLPFRNRSVLFRLIFRVEKDETKNFVILVQSKDSPKGVGRWITLIRYDCSHGFVHKDLLSASGRRVRKKEKLPMQDKRKAIKFIVGGLLSDLETQIGKIRPQGRKKEEPISNQDINSDIRKAEKSLLELFGSTEVFELLQSTSVMYSEEVSSLD